MKRSVIFCLGILLLFFFACTNTGNTIQQNKVEVNNDKPNDLALLTFFDNPRQPISSKFESFPSGITKPKGWILDMMKSDLERGVVGALDELYPGIKADDLYHTARRGGMEDIPEMGDLVLTGAAWEASIMWWNSETSGNWWDGFVRHAFLTGNESAIAQSIAIINNLLESQDEGGYIGIYKPNLRYQHTGANGELWSQATAFRTMLAYYELTRNEKVLEAVEKAMAVTMKAYGKDGRHPFDLESAFGGVTHGLMITDVCETLYRITGNKDYQDYAVWLYKAFSTYSINRSFNDMRYPFLVDRDSLFSGHAVHTYEHLRTLINAYFHTGYPELATAYENAMYKLGYCILPSGAGHGNEWIAELAADATYTSSEFCTMLELRNFFCSAAQKTGDIAFADKAEKLTFNGMMGFRNKNGTALTYGKGDNCYVLDGHHHGKDGKQADPRYKYSPTHSEPAVCCVPNYGRNLPYYLDNMWMSYKDGLAALLYGPSSLKTKIVGQEIAIEQVTNYPFSDEIEFQVSSSGKAPISIYFRQPGWASSINVDAPGADVSQEGGMVRVSKSWTNDVVKVTFSNEVKAVPFNTEVYFQRGALVYAYPIEHREEVIKTYDGRDFIDYYCFPENEKFRTLESRGNNTLQFTFQQEGLSENEFPWHNNKTSLKGQLVDSKSGAPVDVSLVPIGSTILRKVTFPSGE
ncbi:MAG: beta-L-arabinofuranosidase domain-containing protein [Bacteroidota bacterium]